MKRIMCITWILILIHSIHSVAGISSDMQESYLKGETVIVSLKGEILEPIKPEQVEIKRKNIIVPVEYDINKIGEEYYLWFIAPQIENNYTLIINKIVTTSLGRRVEVNYEKNFSVGGNLSDYSIKPAFFITDEEFDINIRLNEDAPKKIIIDYPESKEVLLKPGDNRVTITPIKGDGGLKFITIGKYKLPLYIIKNPEIQIKKSYIEFVPSRIESTILINEKKIYPFAIRTLGESDRFDTKIYYNPEIFLITPSNILPIGKNATYFYNLTLIKKSSEIINEIIYVELNEKRIELPIEIRFTTDNSKVETPYLKNNNEETLVLPYCDGIICTAGEICKGQEYKSKEGVCCIGKCTIEKKFNKFWVVFALVTAIIIVFAYLYWRYKSSNRKFDPVAKKLIEKDKRFP